MDYRIERDGDAIERRWAKSVGTIFTNYEPFWIEHVVPITWRIADRHCIYVRSGTPRTLKKLATYSYGIFIHLAAAHEQLEVAYWGNDQSNAQLFARIGIYTFYGRLYSASVMVCKFLETAKEAVNKYGGKHFKTVEKRLVAHSSGDLYTRYDTLKKRSTDYRNPQVHDWGLPAIGRKIPKREYLDKWADKDLGELDRFIRDGKAQERLAREFTDGIAQAKDDLAFAETVINDVWQVVRNELATISDKSRYQKDQAKGLEDGIPRGVQ